jgi:hypothetical protein
VLWDVKGTSPKYKLQEQPLEIQRSVLLGVICAGDEVMLKLTRNKIVFLLKRAMFISTA